MASEALDPFKVYRGLREAQAGMQLERFFRVLSYALHQWCKYGYQGAYDSSFKRRWRYGDDAPDEGKMLLIEFDKFANVICRIWTEMYKATGCQHLDRIESLSKEDLNKIVRFRPPGEEFPGKHGPGTGRRIPGTDTVAYFSEMAELLAEEKFPYFVFESLQKRTSLQKEKMELEGARARKSDYPHTWVVNPGLAVGDDEIFWEGFTKAEIDFLRNLSTGLKHLGPTEIRALGTHKNLRGTIEEIKRELKWARQVCAILVRELEASRLGLQNAEKLRDYAHEASRKALLNENYYRSAYERLLRELSEEQLKESFQAAQKPASAIWGHRDIPKIRTQVERVVALADYIYAVSYFNEHPDHLPPYSKTKATAIALHSFEDGLKSLHKYGFLDVPESLGDVFEGTRGVIKITTAKQLSVLLNDISTNTDGA